MPSRQPRWPSMGLASRSASIRILIAPSSWWRAGLIPRASSLVYSSSTSLYFGRNSCSGGARHPVGTGRAGPAPQIPPPPLPLLLHRPLPTPPPAAPPRRPHPRTAGPPRARADAGRGGGEPARRGQPPLGGVHARHVLGGRLRAHENHMLLAQRHLHRLLGIEDDLADGRRRSGGQ